MRNVSPSHRRAVVERLLAAWERVPEQRLGQLIVNACDGCAALASVLGAAAPLAGSALGAYARAADDAQRAAELPATAPEVIALRAALAALAVADARVDVAARPVECSEPVPMGAPLPPPAVDQAALDERIARAVTATTAGRKAGHESSKLQREPSHVAGSMGCRANRNDDPAGPPIADRPKGARSSATPRGVSSWLRRSGRADGEQSDPEAPRMTLAHPPPMR